MAFKEVKMMQIGGTPYITVSDFEPEAETRAADKPVHYYHYPASAFFGQNGSKGDNGGFPPTMTSGSNNGTGQSSNESYVIIGTIEYGRLTAIDSMRSSPGVGGIPSRVATDLMTVYGSLPRAMVIIMNNGGKFTIQTQIISPPEPPPQPPRQVIVYPPRIPAPPRDQTPPRRRPRVKASPRKGRVYDDDDDDLENDSSLSDSSSNADDDVRSRHSQSSRRSTKQQKHDKNKNDGGNHRVNPYYNRETPDADDRASNKTSNTTYLEKKFAEMYKDRRGKSHREREGGDRDRGGSQRGDQTDRSGRVTNRDDKNRKKRS